MEVLQLHQHNVGFPPGADLPDLLDAASASTGAAVFQNFDPVLRSHPFQILQQQLALAFRQAAALELRRDVLKHRKELQSGQPAFGEGGSVFQSALP